MADLGRWCGRFCSRVILIIIWATTSTVATSTAVVATAIVATAVVTTAVVTTAATRSTSAWTIMAGRASSFIGIVVFVDPAFDSNDSISGLGFCKTIVDRNAESLKRHFPLTIPLGTSDISTTKTTGTTNTNSVSTELHGGLDCTFHCAAESNTTFQLDHDLLTDALGVELGLTDLNDVDLNLGATGNLTNVSGHFLDLRAFTSDHETRT